MERVTIYLRTSLFTLGGAKAHLPVGAMVVEGALVDAQGGGALTVRCERLLDERGRDLGTSDLTLRLPWAKVDHVVVHDPEAG